MSVPEIISGFQIRSFFQHPRPGIQPSPQGEGPLPAFLWADDPIRATDANIPTSFSVRLLHPLRAFGLAIVDQMSQA